MMKVIRVSIIFSMVTNPLTISLSVLTTLLWHTPIIFLIFSIIYGTVVTWTVGGIALKITKDVKDREKLKTIGVFTLIGNNPLAGFLMLIIKNEQLPANWSEEKKREIEEKKNQKKHKKQVA